MDYEQILASLKYMEMQCESMADKLDPQRRAHKVAKPTIRLQTTVQQRAIIKTMAAAIKAAEGDRKALGIAADCLQWLGTP